MTSTIDDGRTTSTIFDRLRSGGFEQALFNHDAQTGLRSLVLIHDTTLGPALGGVRMHPYETETAALEDGLRLAEAMTLKAPPPPHPHPPPTPHPNPHPPPPHTHPHPPP
ncbi:Glu/Leu/Phe/Val dehydrogenase dimerization domain-containing protein, partial [Streptomyces lasiicapitis]|uniref:Glu/Leu/Phe/Val dehydrogenase dimerization domain-containing protein n=1 Tax=Streptomyces lasiicapitis TaxID=1923961 RepID=UPI0036C3C875